MSVIDKRFGRGEIGAIWGSLYTELWLEVFAGVSSYEDFFVDLALDVQKGLLVSLDAGALAEVTADPQLAEDYVLSLTSDRMRGEGSIVALLESFAETVLDNGGNAAYFLYRSELDLFLIRHNTRYRIVEPCSIALSLDGMHVVALDALRTSVATDVHLAGSWAELESAIFDLRLGFTDSRIKTAIQKYFMFLEVMACGVEAVTEQTLGQQVKQIRTWPHPTVAAAMSSLYGFRSRYPGIGHGTREVPARPLDVRDVISMMSTLSGFTPYFFDSSAALERGARLDSD